MLAVVCIVGACLRGPSYTLVEVVYTWEVCIVVACLRGPSYTLVEGVCMLVVYIRLVYVPALCTLAALVYMFVSEVYN